MIIYILETFASKLNRNGNREWYAVVTSCRTRDQWYFDTHHSSNARRVLFNALRVTGSENPYDQIFEIEHTDIPIRQFQHERKILRRHLGETHESQATDMLAYDIEGENSECGPKTKGV